MSVRASTSSPRTCSGAMNAGVPLIALSFVSAVCGDTREFFDESEVQNLDEIGPFTEPADEDVAGFDIAMDQSGIVSLFE